MQIKKKRQTAATPSSEAAGAAREKIAWAAGSEQFQHRDPVFHVTESFRQTFDRIGRSHARRAAGFDEEKNPEEEGARAQTGASQKSKTQRQDAGPAASEGGGQKLWMGNAPAALTRFSDLAFQRGAMSASVINGTGKMMLASCIRRTAGESGPKRIQQQTLFRTGSQLRNIPGRSPDQMVFHRGFANSALGIVVDTLRDARRVAESMAEMARGTGELSGEDSAAMLKLYPFLDDSRDRALEAEYREKLAACTDEREKPILQNALVQTLSLRAKKAQMKTEFINKLRFLSDRATETLAELEAPGVLDELISSAWGDESADLPENPEEGAQDDASDGSEDDGDPEKRAGNGKDPAKQEP